MGQKTHDRLTGPMLSFRHGTLVRWFRLRQQSGSRYQERVPEAYAQNYTRLSAVGHAYDPDNRFRLTQSVQPQFRVARK